MKVRRVRIVGGSIIDGTGGPEQRIPVEISDGNLVRPGSLGDEALILDASGCVVIPGLVDAHANQTWGPLVDPTCALMTGQGVTAAVTGNCGGSLFPAFGAAEGWISRICKTHGASLRWQTAEEYADALGRAGIRLFPMVGHATLRASIVGFASRIMTGAERANLVRMVQEVFDQGVWGVSFGLTYPPGSFAGTEELLAVCRVAAAYGRTACFHIRLESAHLLESVDEICNLALLSGARVVVCHHKALGRRNWGMTAQTLQQTERARAEGAEIYFDMYPFTSAVRNLAMLLPDEFHEGGRTALVARLRDLTKRAEIKTGLERNIAEFDANWSDTEILAASGVPELEGRRADEVIDEIGLDGLLDALAASDGRILTTYEGACWDDLERVAASPYTMIGSDGDIQVTSERGHPRSSATFPSFLKEFVVKRRTLSLMEAIRRATSLPTQVFGLPGRGTLEPGERADVCVVSDPRLSDNVEKGIWPRHLFVGGEPVILRSETLPNLPGHVVLDRGLT